MLCKNCGIEVIASAKFCHKCGAKIEVGEPPQEMIMPTSDKPMHAQSLVDNEGKPKKKKFKKFMIGLAGSFVGLFVIVIILAAIGNSIETDGGMSGTYVSVEDASKHISFNGETATLYEGENIIRSGKYRFHSNTQILISYDAFSELYSTDENKEILYQGNSAREDYGTVAYIEKARNDLIALSGEMPPSLNVNTPSATTVPLVDEDEALGRIKDWIASDHPMMPDSYFELTENNNDTWVYAVIKDDTIYCRFVVNKTTGELFGLDGSNYNIPVDKWYVDYWLPYNASLAEVTSVATADDARQLIDDWFGANDIVYDYSFEYFGDMSPEEYGSYVFNFYIKDLYYATIYVIVNTGELTIYVDGSDGPVLLDEWYTETWLPYLNGDGDTYGGTGDEEYQASINYINDSFEWVETATGSSDNSLGIAHVKGVVKNASSKTYSYVQIIFNLYDSSGNQIDTAVATINNLKAGGTWSFDAVAFNQNVARFEFSSIDAF